MELQQAALAFGALANPARLELFRLLVRAGDSGMAAGDIARRLGVPPSTLSFHLRELSAVRLLQGTRRGRQIRYAVRAGALRELIWFVGEDCCQGRQDLLPTPTSRIADRLGDVPSGERQTVLFLCTENAARSQLAEAMLRARVDGRYEVCSAGIQPSAVHPTALRVLQEIDVSTDGLRSKDLAELLGKRTIHHAIVLCPEAQADCPKLVPFAGTLEYWPLPDPIAAAPEDQLQRFRDVRDELQVRIYGWLRDRGAARRPAGGRR